MFADARNNDTKLSVVELTHSYVCHEADIGIKRKHIEEHNILHNERRRQEYTEEIPLTDSSSLLNLCKYMTVIF